MSELFDVRSSIPGGPELRARSLELLEFPKVLQALADHAQTPMSRDRILSLTPAYSPQAVAELQQETSEAAFLIDRSATLTMSQDPRPYLQRALMQGLLAGDELIVIANGLELIRKAKSLGGVERGRTPLLRSITRAIGDLRALERLIRSKLTPSGELKDEASPMLRQLRRDSRLAYQAASKGLQGLIEADLGAEVLQDRLFTVRGDRLVLPIKADFKGKIPGIVHGVSDSGATLFIEPLTNVSATNRWREATAADEEESMRILRHISGDVAKRASEALHALAIVARLDAAFAKARYARTYQGVTIPDSADYLDLVDGRHPLLSGRAVPVSISLRPPVTALVVTGPNTGGKTVALKTLGLILLMRQSGMMLPCDRSTRLPVVDGVYPDIGDQQSIEDAVSTFESHMKVITQILIQATPDSMVLIDEIGTSTDPEEGSALARAIVSRLTKRGIPTVVTTHHRAMAAFADDHLSVENASVDLDPVTLAPTYKLTTGLPGRSYAMEIATRIGLDVSIVDAAYGFLHPDHRKAERMLASIQEELYLTRSKLDEAEIERVRAANMSEELEREIDQVAALRETAIEEVRSELLEETKRVQAKLKQAEATAEWEAHRGELSAPRIIRQAGDEVEDLRKVLRSRAWGRRSAAPQSMAAPRVGDTVKIGALGLIGQVLSEPDGSGRVEVLVGSVRLKLEPSRLTRSDQPIVGPKIQSSITLAGSSAAPSMGDEIDIRGNRAQEALEKLDTYLDQALARGLSQVRIVHGKGTGALRQAVWRHLANSRIVVSYELASAERGGDGATEAQFTL